jgi:hypothetical protein
MTERFCAHADLQRLRAVPQQMAFAPMTACLDAVNPLMHPPVAVERE